MCGKEVLKQALLSVTSSPCFHMGPLMSSLHDNSHHDAYACNLHASSLSFKLLANVPRGPPHPPIRLPSNVYFEVWLHLQLSCWEGKTPFFPSPLPIFSLPFPLYLQSPVLGAGDKLLAAWAKPPLPGAGMEGGWPRMKRYKNKSDNWGWGQCYHVHPRVPD